MEKLYEPSTIRRLLSEAGIGLQKSLGQNFLIHPGVCPRMAEAACSREGMGVLEIGPGIGVLTVELARRAEKVIAVEVDRRLAPVLDRTLADCPNVDVVFGDVMKLDLADLLKREFAGMEVAVCANLPYYITSPILMLLLESRLPVSSITVMVQKEAADRFCAPVGSRAAGAVTVAIAYYAEIRRLFPVPAGSFLPAPKVDSAVIQLVPWKTPPVAVRDESALFRLIQAGFAQRRKTLINAATAGGLEKARVEAAMKTLGLSPTLRAEALTLAQFAQLSDILYP